MKHGGKSMINMDKEAAKTTEEDFDFCPKCGERF